MKPDSDHTVHICLHATLNSNQLVMLNIHIFMTSYFVAMKKKGEYQFKFL